ncbi:IgGFc-binding protein [Sandaracinus amylolyticus]|uniref:IgGFc-binding protein n=1 Tax=Sandaracinus amylolyticus TaxID=927083 RepID=UPI001F199CD6|nr:IgGFc-binding protein [Sandaracinus amylolyticus]UJR82426.1 Hypothetical protein I5071_44910 [Sandaracinus amylolyticus]
MTIRVLAVALALVACSEDPRPPGRDAAADDAPESICGEPDTLRCEGLVHYRCSEDGRTREDETRCDEACSASLGCVACVPGQRRCDGDRSEVCLPDGSGYAHVRDCADWGAVCSGNGDCGDECAIAERRNGYIGCEYFAAPLGNHLLDLATFTFRISIANPGAAPSRVRIQRGGEDVHALDVAAGGLEVVTLPWTESAWVGEQPESVASPDAAYRVIADRPVVVTQFNPYEYATPAGAQFSYSNDASLLLPVHALAGRYVGLSFAPFNILDPLAGVVQWTGAIALVGVSPEPVRVRMHLRAPIEAERSGRWPALTTGDVLELDLARGEVVQVFAKRPPPCGAGRDGARTVLGSNAIACDDPAHDLTGSTIEADGPLAVFATHPCLYAPFYAPACDHVEEQLAPVRAWGRSFASTALVQPGVDTANLVRIVASAHDTEVTFDPPPVDGATFALPSRDHRDLVVRGPFAIEATHPVQVSVLTLGAGYAEPETPVGDPALTMLVPREQYRADYTFVAPETYRSTLDGQSYLSVVRAREVEILLDGAPLDVPFRSIGSEQVATFPISGGVHTLVATDPEARIGALVFGLARYTSYAYPAGLDLDTVDLE